MTPSLICFVALRAAAFHGAPLGRSVPVAPTHAAPAPVAADAIRCKVDVVNMEPAKVLRLLSLDTGVNLILLGTSDAKLTLRLTDAPLGDIIRHISAMTGLAWLKVGTTYVVGKAESLAVAYAAEWKAANPAPAPAPLPAPVEIVSQTYRTSFVGGTALANSLTALFKELQIASGPAPLSPAVGDYDGSKVTGSQSPGLNLQEGASRTIMLQGPRPIVERALAVARQLDSPRAQVAIAVTVHDLSNDALRDLGVTWDFGGFGITERNGGFGLGRLDRTGLSASAAIKALERKNAAKLLASPRVSMLDGERGFVLIGDRINFPVLTGYTQNNAPIFDIKEQRVGIYLQVAATVAADGSVTLNLYPQVSTITGYLQVNGASYPQISTREAQTTVHVASGESVVLGGLIRDEDVKLVEKVPILGNLPILGELFRHRRTTHTSSQIVLTVTPTVVLPQGARAE